jgi:hypothetical protein
MSGAVSLHARVSIPPEKKPFLQGDFGIDAGSFSRSVTQEGVNHLSAGIQSDGKSLKADKDNDKKGQDDKDDAATALSDLKGHVLLRGGTARFSNLSFSVPGAVAQMEGTYNLITEKIDLHGTLRTEAAPSNTTHGIKARC